MAADPALAGSGGCFWGGRVMVLEKPRAPRYAKFEHLLPRGLNDRLQSWTIVLAYRACNERRARTKPELGGSLARVVSRVWCGRIGRTP